MNTLASTVKMKVAVDFLFLALEKSEKSLLLCPCFFVLEVILYFLSSKAELIAIELKTEKFVTAEDCAQKHWKVEVQSYKLEN